MFGSKNNKIILPANLLKQLYEIDWFCNCGKQEDRTDLYRDEKVCLALCPQWQETILYHRGIVTEALAARERTGRGKEYRQWNRIVSEFREKELPALNQIWEDKMRDRGIYSDFLISAVRFDILTLVSVFAYENVIDIPPFFYRVLEIYQDGHLPWAYMEYISRIRELYDGNIMYTPEYM